MKSSNIIRYIYIVFLITLLGGLTFCQFGEGDAMDSYQGSGDPLFVAVNSDCYSYISADGKEWNKGGIFTSVTGYEPSVAYGNDLFVAIRNNTVSTSIDGVTWVERTGIDAGLGGSLLLAIIYADGRFIIGASNGSTYYSYDGINWLPGGSVTGEIKSFSYGNDLFFLTLEDSGASYVYVSKDGINWNNSNFPYTSDGSINVAYGNTIFVTVGYINSNSLTTVSQDGTNWSENVLSDKEDGLNCITYGNRRFVAAGQGSSYSSGIVYTSNNGFIWDGPIYVSFTNQINDVVFSNGVFCAVGNNGSITYSEDGYGWSGNVAPAGAANFDAIAVRP